VVATTVAALAASALAYADGIDVSHWQGSVNWSKVDHDGVQFAFMKATDGTSYVDPQFARNWSAAKSYGIYRGAYHFAEPSSRAGSAVAQAQHFVNTVGSLKHAGDLPPVLDLEASGGLGRSALTSWVSTWLSTVERLTGRNPMIYVSPGFWEYYLGNSTAFHHYPLWVAHYGVSSPRVPGGWSTWSFWQRTSTGHVDGVSGYVDMNKFNGSSAQLAKFANTSGGSSTPPTGGPTLPDGTTALTMAPSDPTPAIRQRVAFSGDLDTASTPASAVASAPVALFSRRVGSTAWVQAGTGTTDAQGHYSMTALVRRPADYQVRFAGDNTFAASASSIVRMTTPPRGSLALDLHMDHTTVRPGAALMLYGHLTPADTGAAVSGRTVRYYKRALGGGPWILVGQSHSVAPTGWHSLVVHPKIARVWKVVFPGGDRYLPQTSAYLTVRPR
jgi:lysozyme